MPDLIYLSANDIQRVGLSLDDVRAACYDAYVAKARGDTKVRPKITLPIGPGHSFQALASIRLDAEIAATKWIGVVPRHPEKTGPNISALIVLSDFSSGQPVAIMDGTWVTACRTAAMSSLAAVKLARADAESIGFIGCGTQARSHLSALQRVLPNLKKLVAYSRTMESAQAFALEARKSGLSAEATLEPREAVVGQDVIVSSIPASEDMKKILDPNWVSPGAFVSAVDLGRSWLLSGLEAMDILATDDHEQSDELGRAGKLAYVRPFDVDLSELSTGQKSGRRTHRDRTMFVFGGDPAADLAVASAVYAGALKKGLGVHLQR